MDVAINLRATLMVVRYNAQRNETALGMNRSASGGGKIANSGDRNGKATAVTVRMPAKK